MKFWDLFEDAAANLKKSYWNDHFVFYWRLHHGGLYPIRDNGPVVFVDVQDCAGWDSICDGELHPHGGQLFQPKVGLANCRQSKQTLGR